MTNSNTQKPTLGYVIVYVPDVVKALEFYESAFGFERRFLHESGQYAELETGSTALAFADENTTAAGHVFKKNQPSAKAAGVEVGVVVDNVQNAFSRALRAGASAVVEPAVKPWGQVVSYVRDLNGFLVEICSQVTPVSAS
jgi:lactoylglutathione lyase